MVRRRKWVWGRWWRSRQMNENGWPDMRRGFSSFSSQCTAQYPRQQSQQEINGSNEKIEGVFVDESIKVFQSRRFQFECFNLPRLHDVLLMRQRLCAAGSVFRFPMMAFCCRSYSLNDGISTSALRE